MMRTREEQIRGRCKHFTGIQNKTCGAGVRYDDVRRLPGFNVPCILQYADDSPPCDNRAFPTLEEVAEQIERDRKAVRDYSTARKAITDEIGPFVRGKSPGVGGEIPCPVCTTGTLRYSRAMSNGHVHARCSTDGCVAWME
jgi:hypothetical protein